MVYGVLLLLKPHSVHSLPGNTLCVVALICMAAMVQEYWYIYLAAFPFFFSHLERIAFLSRM